MVRSLIIVFSILILSCNSRWDESLLFGKWKVDDWTTLGTGQKISQRMDFTFNPDKNYVVDYGSQKEIGTWYLAGEYLHTKENGSLDKSVRVLHLNKDTLQFEMNRAGSLELVTLLRE